MNPTQVKTTCIQVGQLNQAIFKFPMVFPITKDMHITHKGVNRLVMIDRYALKDVEKKTLVEGDFVVVTTKEDPKFPARGLGFIQAIDVATHTVTIWIEEDYRSSLIGEEAETGVIVRSMDAVEKPLEVYWEQIAKRNAFGLASVEKTEELKATWFEKFYEELKATHFIPAGRVLYGAGSGSDVTFFNCYVMPMPKDSRGGLAEHRKEVMEIMSRGGGVGTNGSTLRPRHTLARGVNGKSSGSVSWLDDIAKLTHLVQQGGSRRGAQMIMMSINHPDIVEFIISKMQNPRILRFLIDTTNDPQIKQFAQEKLNFIPFTMEERQLYEEVIANETHFSSNVVKNAKEKLQDGGRYEVHNPEFLSGANISVCMTKEFMEAVEADREFALMFPDVENYDQDMMAIYNETWHEVGDVREWKALGYGVKTYRTIQAKELWNLINICATYAAEPGIFFMDNANDMTNAKAYGQKVVATNPCGEQPLSPYAVCNLAAINLAKMVDKEHKVVDFERLKETVRTGIRMQDNVIDATPYFLEANKQQALGERRIGLGVMGLADLLIYCEKAYGSPEGNVLVDQVFETIAVTAYETSVELAKERGSFPFLVGETTQATQELRERFIHTGFMKKMPTHIREAIMTHGIRNSHLLTVAPTGSTGTMVGVATGLEPYFAFTYFRSGRLGKFLEVNADIVEEYLANNPHASKETLPPWFVSAMDLAPEAHVDVQCIIQRWVDSSLSKTVNAPKGYSVSQVQRVYERLYTGGAKGGTVYVDGSRDSQVLTLTNDEETEQQIDDTIKVAVISTKEEISENTIGTDIGDTCPVCRKGVVEAIGGCHTCTNCQVQLQCGL